MIGSQWGGAGPRRWQWSVKPMPGMDGIEALRQIVTHPGLAATRVIMLTRATRPGVVPVGDAAFAGSVGMGTSMALVGAYVLAGELAASAGDHRQAFERYEREMRPFVELNLRPIPGGTRGPLPTRFEIWMRNQFLRLRPHLPGRRPVGRNPRRPPTRSSFATTSQRGWGTTQPDVREASDPVRDTTEERCSSRSLSVAKRDATSRRSCAMTRTAIERRPAPCGRNVVEIGELHVRRPFANGALDPHESYHRRRVCPAFPLSTIERYCPAAGRLRVGRDLDPAAVDRVWGECKAIRSAERIQFPSFQDEFTDTDALWTTIRSSCPELHGGLCRIVELARGARGMLVRVT